MQWSRLPTFSRPIINTSKLKKLSMRKLKFKLLYGLLGMFLFFRIQFCFCFSANDKFSIFMWIFFHEWSIFPNSVQIQFLGHKTFNNIKRRFTWKIFACCTASFYYLERETLKIADIIVICLFSSIVIFQIFFSDISHRLNFADRKFCVIRAKTNTLKLSFKRCFSIMGETWYLSKRSHIKHTWPWRDKLIMMMVT